MSDPNIVQKCEKCLLEYNLLKSAFSFMKIDDGPDIKLCTKCLDVMMKERVKLLKEHLYEFIGRRNDFTDVDGWIKVTDKMPEEREHNLIALESGYVAIGYWSYDHKKRLEWQTDSHCCAELDDGEVTHWMPLPKEPQDSE